MAKKKKMATFPEFVSITIQLVPNTPMTTEEIDRVVDDIEDAIAINGVKAFHDKVDAILVACLTSMD
jgi:hypothetical protein